jgi:hypothetical protein
VVPTKKTCIAILFLVVGLMPLASQPATQSLQQADSLLKKYGEVYLLVPVQKTSDLNHLSRAYSVDAVYPDSARICVNRGQFVRLMSEGIPFRVFEIKRPPVPKGITETWQGWNSYPTYQQYDSVMQQFAADYPSIFLLDTIGYSVNGRLLLMAKISDHVEEDEPEPEFMYSSTIHGDETGGFILMLRWIDYLLSHYGSDTLATQLVDSLELWVCPLANPDGTYHGGDKSVSGSVRYNANGVDLNRNFPDPQDGDHPDGNEYQPETIAMITFHENRHIGMSVNFHAGDEVVNYPWDTWPQRHADDPWFQRVSRIYADTVHLYSSGYMTGFDNGITNGYDWYSINGGRQDYVTYFREGRESTIELDNTKITPENELDQLWEYNYRSFLYYAHQAVFGLDGFVTDSVTGAPVYATITIPGHDVDHSEVSSDSVYGYFHRYLASGSYDLLISADHYRPKTIYGVDIWDDERTMLSVSLAPEADRIPVSETLQSGIHPNPVRRGGEVILTIPSRGHFTYRFISIDGKLIFRGEVDVNRSERIPLALDKNIGPGTYILVISGVRYPSVHRVVVLP